MIFTPDGFVLTNHHVVDDLHRLLTEDRIAIATEITLLRCGRREVLAFTPAESQRD